MYTAYRLRPIVYVAIYERELALGRRYFQRQ